MFSTPLGRPASCHQEAISSAVAGVCSDGLKTTVFPASSAGTTCPFGRWAGKLNGPITTMTPCGWWEMRKVAPPASRSSVGVRSW